MLTLRLYMAQRLTALLMVPFVLTHLAVMIYAIRGGLSASEILSRTQGSVAWFLFYGGFVVAVSIHAAIGLRVIVHELAGLRGLGLSVLTWAIGLALLGFGMQSVWAVTVAP